MNAPSSLEEYREKAGEKTAMEIDSNGLVYNSFRPLKKQKIIAC